MTPVKSYSMPVCTLKNVRKHFARMPASQLGSALPLNSDRPDPVQNALQDTPSVVTAAYLVQLPSIITLKCIILNTEENSGLHPHATCDKTQAKGGEKLEGRLGSELWVWGWRWSWCKVRTALCKGGSSLCR